jgi:hypothetical protein
MKKLKFSALWALMLAFAIGFAGCSKDDDTPNVDEMLDDGLYITGTAAPATGVSAEGLFSPAANEAEKNAARTGLYEIYVLLKQGEFKLTKVTGGKADAELGGALKYTYNGSGVGDQIKSPAHFYNASAGGAAIQISAAGLYHIVYDTQLSRIIVMNAGEWGLRGDLNGWGFTVLTPNSDFTEFTVSTSIKGEGNFKFARSNGWKIGVEDTLETATIKVNANFGGTKESLVAGGADIPILASGQEPGVYTVTLKFTPGKGFSLVTFNRTGNLVLNPAGQATFRVTVPGALENSQVGIVGNFADSSWAVPGYLMEKSGTEYTLTTAVPEGFEYKFVISNYANTGWFWEDGGNREMPLNLQPEAATVTAWAGDPFSPPAATEEGTFKITVENHPGEDWDIYFTGNFDDHAWGDTNRKMTQEGETNVYTWTGQYPITGFEYKILAKKDGESDKWATGDNVKHDDTGKEATLSF